MKRLIFLMFFVLLLPLTFAQYFDGVLDNPEELMNDYNENLESVPSFVKKIFGNERINLHLQSKDATEIFSAETQKAVLLSLKKGEISNPTLDVYLKEDTLNSIINSENPSTSLKQALDSQEITYEAIGLKTKLKLFFTKLILKFL